MTGNKARCLLLSLLFSIVLEVSNQSNKARQRNQKHTDWKGKSETSLVTDTDSA